MASVTQITQFLYHSDPKKSLTRLTLYHYLKNACDLGIEFNEKLVSQFVDHCLNFQYWRDKETEMGEEIIKILSELSKENLLEQSMTSFDWLHTLQTVGLHYESDRTKAIELFLNQQEKGLKHRFAPLGDHQILTMTLQTSGGLRARCFTPYFRIQNGQLQPMTPTTDLEYTSYMELMPGRMQRLALDNIRFAHITQEENTYTGRMIQGHHFQMAGSIHTKEIASSQEIFYRLKFLEKFFIDRQSDPFYMELIDQLERVYHLLSSQSPQAVPMAPSILKKGQIALRDIFQKDKLLLLLVTNIEYMLNTNQQSPQPQPESSSQSWQKVRPLPQ